MSVEAPTDPRPPTPTLAYIGVGSNTDPRPHIHRALVQLAAAIPVRATSTFYWTEPIGRPEQDRYLNGVWQIELAGDPRDLQFEVLRAIEADLGRTRSDDRYAARTLDLDLVLVEGLAVAPQADGWQLPDPDIRSRRFLAQPLSELQPSLCLPDTGESVAAIACGLQAQPMDADADFTARLIKELTT